MNRTKNNIRSLYDRFTFSLNKKIENAVYNFKNKLNDISENKTIIKLPDIVNNKIKTIANKLPSKKQNVNLNTVKTITNKLNDIKLPEQNKINNIIYNSEEDAVKAFNRKFDNEDLIENLKNYSVDDLFDREERRSFINNVEKYLTKKYLIKIYSISPMYATKEILTFPLTIEKKDEIFDNVSRGYFDIIDLARHYDNKALNEPIFKSELIEVDNFPIKKQYNGFFHYLNTTNINLENYQIYSKNKSIRKTKEQNQSCIIYSLLSSGIEKTLIESLIVALQDLTINIPLSKMNDICDIIKSKILLYTYDETKQTIIKPDNKKFIYGKKYENEIKLAQFKNHIFILEDTKYTKFYLDNMDEIDSIYKDDETKFLLSRKVDNKFYKSKIQPKKYNSLELVVYLFKMNKFISLALDDVKEINDNYEPKASLSNIENDQKIFNSKNDDDNDEKENIENNDIENNLKNKKGLDTIYLFGDLETDVVTDKYHKMIAFGFMDENENYYQITYPEKHNNNSIEDRDLIFKKDIIQTIEKALNKLNYNKTTHKVIMFFHNLKYDANILDTFNQFYCSAMCVKDSMIYSKTYNFGFNIKIELKDSMKHFSIKLSDAPKVFDLNINKKEAINYEYHTINNISSNELIDKKIYEQGLKDSDKIIFNELIKTKTFNPTEYYLEYLKFDCLVLKRACLKYRDLMKIATNGLDVFQSLTISSLAHKMAIEYGCYDNIAEIKGELREFLQKSVRGGRVYVNPIYQKTTIDTEIEDFDAVSLYPSAMSKLCEKHGLPMGLIKKGLENNIDYYNSKSYYFVRIRINKINKKIQIPCVCVHDEKTGNLKYINELEKPIEVIVDKITLQDYIEFQDIEYEILEGVYWDQGFNTKIKNLVDFLHKERCKYKQINIPLSNMIKLIMNSIYGKTCMRRSTEQIVILNNKKADKYIFDHFGIIKSIEQNKLNTIITKRKYDNSYSFNYVGAMILSQSKQIVNQVFSVMDENQMNVYYTDTDSIHMDRKDVNELGLKFKDKYRTELIGKNFGQFHVDFDLKGCKDVHSIKHIPIETKTYLDILKGTDDNGNEKIGYHIRMKGVRSCAIDYELNRRNELRGDNESDNNIRSAIELFEDLKNNIEVEMYLNPSKFNVSFDFTKRGVVTKPTMSFKRTLNKQENDNNKDNKTKTTTPNNDDIKWKWIK